MMIRTWGTVKEKFYKLNLNTSISIVYAVIITIVAIGFYPLIPLILNFPPGTVNTDFQIKMQSSNYIQQFFAITLFILLFGIIFLKYKLKFINEWSSLIERNDEESIEKLAYIRRKCLTLPYSIYIIQIIVPTAIVFILHSIIDKGIGITTIKIVALIFSFITLAAVVTHIFSKKIFTQILFKTYKKYEDKEVKRINLRNKIFLQILPIFIVAVLFTSLIGYSRLTKEKGDLIYDSYNQQLISKSANINKVKDASDIQKVLKKIELKNPSDCTFIISPNNKVLTSDGSILNDFFLSYLRELSPQHGGRIFDAYASDIQGASIRIGDQKNSWILGVKYEVTSNATVAFFFISFIILLGLNSLILSYFSKSLADDISMVAKGLSEIAEGGDVENAKPLPVTSNDEIGDLVRAFNKIQELEVAHIEEIKKTTLQLNEKNEELTALNQEMIATNEALSDNMEMLKQTQDQLVESERLASLGQLIGGIAHNLKTPIMSIAGGIEAVEELASEVEEDTIAGTLEKQDYIEISKEIKDWIVKIKEHQAYMSDIITTVKGQAVQMNVSAIADFDLDELLKRIEILMKHELKQAYCTMNVDVQVDRSIKVKGEINNLIQILNNLIANAIQAYDEKGGEIEFSVTKEKNNVKFSIKDSGKGIPKEVQEKLFNSMVTTKGKNGTGLGLYMSYSTIKGHFGGNMWFESEEGKGTTFYVTVPLLGENKEKA